MIQLFSRFIDSNASYPSKSWIERVVLAGLTRAPKAAVLRVNDGEAQNIEIIQQGSVFVLRKPAVSIVDNFSITLTY